MYLNASAMSTNSCISKKFLLIAPYTLTSFRLKYENWARMMESGVAKGTILSWLDNEYRRSLFFFVDTMGELAPALTLEPIKNKFIQRTEGKFVFFLKRSPVTIQVENFRSDVIFGDAPVNVAHNFPIYLSEVFLVLLRCPLNLQPSPETIHADVTAQVCNLQSSFAEATDNNANNWSNFFAAIDISLIMKAARDIRHGNSSPLLNPKVRNDLEGIIIKLIEQIYKQLSDSPLSLSTVQPESEVHFWNARLTNLQHIYEQLQSPLIKAVGNILTSARSAYTDAFYKALKDVELGLHEASDITLYLNPISEQTLQFRKVCFINAGPLMRPLVHVIFLAFWNSKFYTTNQRTTTLLRAHCNLLARKAVDDMEISLLFQIEPQEAYAKLAKTIEIIKEFKKQVLEYQEKGACTGTERFRPPKLLFRVHDVFADVDVLLNQFTDFLQVFSIADSFKSLEKVETGGLHGRVVAVQLLKIKQEHDKLLEQVAADCALIFARRNDNRSLSKTVKNYVLMTTALEKKLVTIIANAFEECTETEQYMKLLRMTSKLFDLPTLRQDMQPVVTQMLTLWIDEFTHVNINLEKMICGEISTDRQLPPTISQIVHIRRHRSKIYQLVKIEVELGCTMKLFGLDLRDYVSQCEKYLSDLERLQDALLRKWIKSTEENFALNLNKTILTYDLLNRVQVNFSDSLERGLRELKYIIDIGINIPMPAKEVHLKRIEIWLHKCRVTQIAEWYNDIQESQSCVFSLVKDEFAGINKRIDETFRLITWNDYNDALVNDIFTALKSLTQRMQTVANQTNTLISEIRLWLNQELCQGNVSGTGVSLIENIKVMSANNLEQCNVIKSRVLDVASQNCILLDKNLNEMSDNIEKLESFKNYKRYLCQLVEGEIIQGIKKSLTSMERQTDSSEEHILPLFELSVILDCGHVSFRPSLGANDRESFLGIVLQLIGNILQTIQAVPGRERSMITESESSGLAVAKEIGVERCVKTIIENTRMAMISSLKWASVFEKYEILWKNDVPIILNDLVRKSEVLDGNLTSEIEEILPKLLDEVKSQVDFYSDMYEEVENLEEKHKFGGFLLVNAKAAKQEILNYICKQANVFKDSLRLHVNKFLMKLEMFVTDGLNALNAGVDKADFDKLYDIMRVLNQLENVGPNLDNTLKPLKEAAVFLNMWNASLPDTSSRLLEELSSKWSLLKKVADKTLCRISPVIDFQKDITRKGINLFIARLQGYYMEFFNQPVFKSSCQYAYYECDRTYKELVEFRKELYILKKSAALFSMAFPSDTHLKNCLRDLKLIKQVWDFVLAIESCINKWKATAWIIIDTEEVENESKQFFKGLRSLEKSVRAFQPYIDVDRDLKHMMVSLRTTAQLQNKAITERHWMDLITTTKLYNVQPIQCLMSYKTDQTATFAQILSLNLHSFDEEVSAVVERAIKEQFVSNILAEIHSKWSKAEFECDIHDRRNIRLPKVSEEFIEGLEESQLQLQMASSSKHTDYIMPQIRVWQDKLAAIDQVVGLWLEVQRKWIYLENIFIGSDGICVEIPRNSPHRFEAIDQSFIEIVDEMLSSLQVLRIIENHELCRKLATLLENLNLCEKALNNYLETKRLAFPRFYFISSADLLDILANGNNPSLVVRHLIKLFDSVAGLSFHENSKLATSMTSKESIERVDFCEPCDCSGKVENWLNRLIDCMRTTIRTLFEKSLAEFHRKERKQWLKDWPAQVALCCEQINWTSSVEKAFALQHEGYENAMKEFHRKQISNLNSLISLLSGDLAPGIRQKIMTICTISVHCRDFVAKVIQTKVEDASSFQWQSQLRHRWDTLDADCYANICDAKFLYAYEYLGNTPRLVVTPLTDRCYITLTQSLRLVLGGAPAGPAGTGKTETIKDLGRALGVIVYVFNCSEQMDYKSCGNIYKGLAQTGAWGCFDEFNRIAVEVLSVIAIQVKTIQDAIKAHKKEFIFMENTIHLEPSVGIFVTMNPGYAGRTELPENLKSLFRPCAMFVADFALICEIMLVAEGFQEARFLARKFITLYDLCREILSKQDHYDWGLRAIKSVLVVAGSLKRNDANLPEEIVLMRALRDFNVPKLVTDDVLIFGGLFNDLFPVSEVPSKRSCGLEEAIRRAAISLKLQPNEAFTLKVNQLQELLDVRHCLFVVGSAGCGKTRIWQTLFTAYKLQQLKPHYDVLNPKAVSNDELFGCVNTTTREWKDGLLSVIMRDQANMDQNGPKWIVLDGDIDPIWIENLNTVMDDNKVLTLANNERITLKKEMRLLFEVGHLEAATPATVSRAGVLYINRQDLGWLAIVASWLETRNNPVEKATLRILFEKYFPIVVPKLTCFQRVTITTDITTVQMICRILECLLDKAQLSDNNMEQICEAYLNFSIVWGAGSNLLQDNVIDWRKEFHKWYTAEFRSAQFPLNGTIFDYCIDLRTNQFSPWSNIIPSFEVDSEKPLTDVIIPTAETTRNAFILKLLMLRGHPVLLVGNSGSGKNTLLKLLFRELHEQIIVKKAHFNFYSTAESFQAMLDKPLEKLSGKTFGPGRNKNLVYFINDFNMAQVDAYGTVQVHTVVRQFMDYRQWYDKSKLSLKDIKNCQFVACMSPSAGSFTIDPRLQHHFFVLAVNHLNDDTLRNIYLSIFRRHIESSQFNFTKEVQAIAGTLVSAGIALQRRVENTFLPTAVKYHHIFNMRDMTNIFQGLLLTRSSSCPKPNDLIRFYVHEAQRVYGDRFMESNDIKSFNAIIKDTFKKYVEDLDEEYVFAEPMIFCHFSVSLLDQKYTAVKSWNQLLGLLSEAQKGYNESIGHINLILFEDAIKHICRINRVLESPHGNALLIGVGGSGKQTLSRLAAFISSLTTFELQLKRGYCLQDMRTDIAELYMKVGIKNVWTMFLLSDSYILDETHLTFISDILASGEIPDLFDEDQIDGIMSGVRNELKQLNIADDRESCYKFFIEKVRRMLKIVLCFSPAGATLRTRARQFPVIINKTYIDWFHEWPKAALESVSKKFLSEIDILPTQLVNPVSSYMAYVHQTVNMMSNTFLQNERRYNYTTPKTFLEYIALYSKLLTSKTKEIIGRIDRLQSGMAKLADCTKQVDTLQEQLAKQLTLLNAKNEAADKLIVLVGAESEKVKREKMVVSEEERRVRVIEEDITIKTKLCEDDLRRAEPALLAAQAALNTLNKTNLTELKSFGSPPRAVINVCAAVMVLLAPSGRVPRDRGWRSAKLMMGKVDQFLNDLVNYDKDNIPPNLIEELEEYLKDPEFNPEKIVQKSVAAAGLCAWTINLYKYHQVFQVVGPKQQALESSQQKLNEARTRLKFLKGKIDELEQRLSAIQLEFTAALNEKQKCQRVADKTSATISLAHRLVNGLGNENVRWKELISRLQENVSAFPGDALLISSFLSYVGSFTRAYREELYNKLWIPVFSSIEPAIPYTPNVEPLNLICDEAQIAVWHNEGLPKDLMSIENAAILTNSSRWPLIIDPQMQGIKWIKKKYGVELVVLRLAQKGFLEKLETSMARGDTVLIEYIEETIDSILEPLLSRTLIKKGHCIKIGDKEMDYNSQFKLILHTKFSNPHFKPEIQAHTTLINFTVTRDGLQDQLLAEVIKAERSDLEEEKTQLTIQQNSFRIALKNLEDELLVCLATAKKSILDDCTLVENLEATKKTVLEMESKVKETKIATKKIDESRDHYRPAAHRASILYFVLADLQRINPLYVFSLKSFISVFRRAISVPNEAQHLQERVDSLVKLITHEIFRYTLRGLFEKDKLTFVSHMSLQILLSSVQVSREEIDFLLRYPADQNTMPPLNFISSSAWGGIKSLSMIEGFFGLDSDIEEFPRRWRQLVENECPEKMPLPGEWKNRTPLQKLCIIRCLRPERICHFFREFNMEVLGAQYGSYTRVPFSETFAETNASTPIFFILSPGTHPLADVERLGTALNVTHEQGNFHNISLGQDQELLAEGHLESAVQAGHWVILQNVHLVSKWLPRLEKFVGRLSESSHPAFRLIITAEPAAHFECHIIPKGILEPSLKIVEEPPCGVSENFHRALDNVSHDTFEDSAHESEMRCILFSLCYFHAVIVERRKFQTLGWNNSYPFNYGDLSICADILRNYLSENSQIPWEDLRYLFGEIIYGGHITDNWDRRLCQTYLEEFIQPDLVDGDFYLCPGFRVPAKIDFTKCHEYVSEHLPQETPSLYGLAANANIALLNSSSELLLKTLLELQPTESNVTSSSCTQPREELIRIVAVDTLDRLQDEFNTADFANKVKKCSPYIAVAMQECERMNLLIKEIRRSLKELLLCLKGELTMTAEMEGLQDALFYGNIPKRWLRLAYPSLLSFHPWFQDFTLRIRELQSWCSDFKLPPSVWLGGLFNPQSFLTAIMQESARKNRLPLDNMHLYTNVTKRFKDDVSTPPAEGALLHGLFLEGAAWDCNLNSIVSPPHRELTTSMPLILAKASSQENVSFDDVYQCPVYKTRIRGQTYVWCFDLKTRVRPSKWILGGVALLLQVS